MRSAPIIAMLLAACGSEPSGDPATLGSLAYLVPSGWTSRDLSTQQRELVEWTPVDNERKEALDVYRARREALAKAGEKQIAGSLRDAQQTLPAAKFGAPIAFRTRHGYAGIRIEGDVTPVGGRTYRRIHAVLIDGASLLNVIYTAAVPDRDHFELVIDSFRPAQGV